jgi:hypothetical protein|tara:strand:+ start:463 stop:864 length:402 start_codon:yes stop_codon:yes gene_type:complete
MTGNNPNTKTQDQSEDCRSDETSTSMLLQEVEKANTLIGKVIRKDGVDYGKIVKIITIASHYSRKHVAVTDKDIKIDVASIFRLIAQSNGSEKFYPDGTSYSVRAMRSPKRKGSGQAITGNTTTNSLKKEGIN